MQTASHHQQCQTQRQHKFVGAPNMKYWNKYSNAYRRSCVWKRKIECLMTMVSVVRKLRIWMQCFGRHRVWPGHQCREWIRNYIVCDRISISFFAQSISGWNIDDVDAIRLYLSRGWDGWRSVKAQREEDTGNCYDRINQGQLDRIGIIGYLEPCTVIESGLVDLFAT